jgi:hypothetical protein
MDVGLNDLVDNGTLFLECTFTPASISVPEPGTARELPPGALAGSHYRHSPHPDASVACGYLDITWPAVHSR